MAKRLLQLLRRLLVHQSRKFEFDEKTKKNIAKHSAYCEYLDRLAAGEKGLVDPCLDEDDETSDDEYPTVDEINMEGFCLMAGSTKQKKLDQSHLESAEVKRIMAEAELYFDEESASQNDDCSLGNGKFK